MGRGALVSWAWMQRSCGVPSRRSRIANTPRGWCGWACVCTHGHAYALVARHDHSTHLPRSHTHALTCAAAAMVAVWKGAATQFSRTSMSTDRLSSWAKVRRMPRTSPFRNRRRSCGSGASGLSQHWLLRRRRVSRRGRRSASQSTEAAGGRMGAARRSAAMSYNHWCRCS